MIEEIYLVRHGIVGKYPNHDKLTKEGIDFSDKKLPSIFKSKNIDMILYDNYGDNKRCKATIKNLKYKKIPINLKNINFENYSQYKTLLICYRKENLKKLEKELTQVCKEGENSNICYEYVFHLKKSKNQSWNVKRIPTECSKTD